MSRALIEQAKRRTGIESDTDLIEFALASIALEDNFAAGRRGPGFEEEQTPFQSVMDAAERAGLRGGDLGAARAHIKYILRDGVTREGIAV